MSDVLARLEVLTTTEPVVIRSDDLRALLAVAGAAKAIVSEVDATLGRDHPIALYEVRRLKVEHLRAALTELNAGGRTR